MRWIKLICIVSLPLVACMSTEPVPEDYFYRLPLSDTSVESKYDGLLQHKLTIQAPKAKGVYLERAILYVDAQRPMELRQYHYRHWIKTPSELIQEHMLAYFQQAKIAPLVTREGESITPTYLISGRLLGFERIVGVSGVKVAIKLELSLHNLPTGDTVAAPPQGLNKVYAIEESAAEDSIHSSVLSFSTALTKIYARFLADLKADIMSTQAKR